MDCSKLISVIIPIYNVEKYLKQCLESVCIQTYPNLEIVLIDDGSTDHSGIIADQFGEKDSRIKVFHIKNRGAAGARNFGLSAIQGDYVSFVDSDDWLEPDYIERLLKLMIENDCDISQCQFYDELVTSTKKHSFTEGIKVINDEDFIRDMINNWEDVLIWNKLYKRNVLDGIRFVEGRCIDDEFFTYKIVMNCEKIVVSEEYLYHYRNRKSGAMGSVDKHYQRLTDQLDFVTERYGILVQSYPVLRDKLLRHKAEVYIHVLNNAEKNTKVFERAKRLLMHCFFEMAFNMEIDMYMKRKVFRSVIRRKGGKFTNSQQLDYYD